MIMDDDLTAWDGPFAVPSSLLNDFPIKARLRELPTVLEPIPPLAEPPEVPLGENLLENDHQSILGGLDTISIEQQITEGEAEEALGDISAVSVPTNEEEPEDLWQLAEAELAEPLNKPYKSWEDLTNPGAGERCMYLSEASTGAFDIILNSCDHSKEDQHPVKSNVFINALCQLGLGRDSLLFAFEKDASITWRIQQLRGSGVSRLASQSLVDSLGECGRLFRRVQRFGIYVYRKGRFPPATVAFAQLSARILLILEKYIADKLRGDSIIEVQEVFKLPFRVLTLLDDLFSGLRRLSTDQTALSYVFEIAQGIEKSELSLVKLLQEILSHMSRPWLESVSDCIGLINRDASNDQLRDLLERSLDWSGTLEDEESFNEAFPTFFGSVDRRLVMQIFQTLKVLRNQGSKSQKSSHARTLRWHFIWDEFASEDKQTSAELAMTESLHKQSATPHETKGNGDSPSSDDLSATFQARYAQIEIAQAGQSSIVGDLEDAVLAAVDLHTIDYQIADQASFAVAAAISFKPVLAQRAKEVNRLCLKEIFFPRHHRDHRGLMTHLEVLRRFVLLTDGMFVIRLSHALFDPELSSGETSERHVSSSRSGLRLGSRTTWPPASSELQLALAGILATSLTGNEPLGIYSQALGLPGNISFSLRQMTDEEISRCLEPHSLEALDFLKVSYTPPQPLDIVITSEALSKYDELFKLLLRLHRLVFVVNHSFSSLRKHGSNSDHSMELRFAHAAHHLVTSFCDYVNTTAIAEPWQVFSRAMDELEYAAKADQMQQATGDQPLRRRITELQGIDYMRSQHDRALDQMLFGCLLRQRHVQVRGLLEDCFRIILHFAALVQQRSRTDTTAGSQTPHSDPDHATEVKTLYARFRKQVSLLIQVCKGLSERCPQNGDDDYNGGLRLLVSRLTINNFYDEGQKT